MTDNVGYKIITLNVIVKNINKLNMDFVIGLISTLSEKIMVIENNDSNDHNEEYTKTYIMPLIQNYCSNCNCDIEDFLTLYFQIFNTVELINVDNKYCSHLYNIIKQYNNIITELTNKEKYIVLSNLINKLDRSKIMHQDIVFICT